VKTAYVVGFSGVRGDPIVSIRRDGGVQGSLDPWHYRVQVEGDTPEACKWLAIQMASRLYIAALSGMPQPTARASGKVNMEEDDKPPPAFDPEEIMPFVLEARRDAVAIANRAIRLELSSREATASTDCRSHVTVNPEPFLYGRIEAGRGRIYHEASHIRFDTEAPRLLSGAALEGGELLQSILNLILDRRSDDLNARRHPGFRMAIRRRMGYLMPGIEGMNGTNLEARHDVFVDFAYACKKRTKPHHRVVCKAMKIVKRTISRVNDRKRKYWSLLGAAKEVMNLLLSELPPDQMAAMKLGQSLFAAFMRLLRLAVHGCPASKQMQAAFRAGVALRLDAENKQKLAALPQTMTQLLGTPGQVKLPQLAEERREVRVIDLPPNHAKYAESLGRVRHYLPRLRQVLEELAQPRVIERKGLDEGDLDEDELALLAVGGTDVFMRSDEVLELDVAIGFLLDTSGSMSDRTDTIDLGTLMNEALTGFPGADGYFFGFDDVIWNCGGVQPGNGIASLTWQGGTFEAPGLMVVGNALAKSPRRRKLLLTVCDGGPADVKEVKRACERLLAAGILPVRLLVGVDAAPRTYPVELFFDSFDQLFSQLAAFLRSLMLAMRS
jgi:hypothetical protein